MATSLIVRRTAGVERICDAGIRLSFVLKSAHLAAEESPVNSLLDNTARLLETASACCQANPSPTDWTVFFGPEGGLQMVAGAADPLPSLAWTRGAHSVWRVSHQPSSVRVEGWQAGQRCILESPKPSPRLVADLRLYELAA